MHIRISSSIAFTLIGVSEPKCNNMDHHEPHKNSEWLDNDRLIDWIDSREVTDKREWRDKPISHNIIERMIEIRIWV